MRDCIKSHIPSSEIHSGLEIGVGTGFLTQHLQTLFSQTHWTLNDLTSKAQVYTDKFINPDSSDYLWGDAEQIKLPSNLDLIASASTVQWFDSLPDFIKQCSANTNKDGYLALSTFGPDNFTEIRNITGAGLNYYSLAELITILESNDYTILQSLDYTKQLEFTSPLEVLKHIKATGVNGISHYRWTRSKLSEFESTYQQLCPQGIALTYHPIILLARKN